jgi:hypothetical protein
MNLLNLLTGDDKSRRRIGIYISTFSVNGYENLDRNLINTVIEIAQKYGIQSDISFNSNFLNGMKVKLDEYVLYHQEFSKRKEELKKNWGNQVDFLKEICNLKDSIKHGSIEGTDIEFLLGKNATILNSWVPEGGG